MTVCVNCGANRVEYKRVWEHKRDGARVRIPAYVCGACGERVFDFSVLAELEK